MTKIKEAITLTKKSKPRDESRIYCEEVEQESSLSNHGNLCDLINLLDERLCVYRDRLDYLETLNYRMEEDSENKEEDSQLKGQETAFSPGYLRDLESLVTRLYYLNERLYKINGFLNKNL